MSAEHRVLTRRSVQLTCEVVRERGFRLLSTRTLDVSSEGMRVAWNGEAVLTGEPVIATLRVAGMWIDLEGSIVRVSHGRRAWDTAALGVSFDVIAPAARAVLSAALLGLPEAQSSRRQLSVRRARVELDAHRSALREMLAGFAELATAAG